MRESKTFADHGIILPGGSTGEIDVSCPECTPERKKKYLKDLSVNVEAGLWSCHHCGWSGSLDNTEDWRAVKYNASRSKKYVVPSYKAPMMLPDNVLDWFIKRGITPETIAQQEIGFSNGWIKFPFKRGGVTVNVKSRKLSDKQFYQEKGAEKILYGMEVDPPIDPSNIPLIWVEGEMDRLSLLEAGFVHVVSVPDGAPAPGTKMANVKFDYLLNCEDYINSFKEHIIAVDNDIPGDILRDELARRIGIERCRKVTWPSDCKDANDVLVAHGKREIEDCIMSARYFPVEGVFEVKDILQDAMRLYDEGMTRGVSTGWSSLDRYLSIRPGELCILTGIPSSGKSSWLDALVINLAINEGWKTGVFSPENAPLSQHFKKLSECYIGKSFLPDTRYERMTPDDVVESARFMHEHFYFISPNESMYNIDEILSRAKALVFRYGIQFLIIDPYNDIDQTMSRDDNMSDRASVILSKCQRFARIHKVFVCLVAHPTKLRKDERTGEYPCPTPYDISGAAHFRNRADICLAGHRPDLTKDIMELHVQKVRFKEVGDLGMVRLDYSKQSGRFFDHIGSFSSTRQARAMAAKEVNAELQAARAAHEDHSGGEG
jgi:twinkle protein